jgi:hypothetical protein
LTIAGKFVHARALMQLGSAARDLSFENVVEAKRIAHTDEMIG